MGEIASTLSQTTTLIVAVVSFLTALSGLITAIVQIHNLKVHINSRMDELMMAQKTISHAEGVEIGRHQRNA